VLLVDWSMPVMSGIELTQRLRARGVDDSYIIMLTSRDSTLDYEQGYRAGVDDYLTKKVRDTELLARIHSGFSTYALRRSLKEVRAELAVALANKAA
jgi:DNA-binding response OmpR family regulator